MVEKGDFLDIEVRGVPADVGDGVVDDGQVFQPEEIHFQEADLGDGVHVVLSDDLALVAAGEGDMFIERAVSDDDAGGVDTDAAVDAFEAEGVGPEFLVGGGGLDELAQLGLRVPLGLEGGAGFRLDHFRDAVGLAVGNPHDPGNVAEDGLRAHGAVGDDVGDGFLAVFFPHVIDDLGAAGLAEVDIDVGRGDALGVEETFEEEAELERADVGDAHRVGGERTGGGAPAGADGDVVVARPLDEVRSDEEVGGKAEGVDGIDLVFQALGDLGGVGFFLAVAFHEAVLADFHQVVLARGAVGRGELRVFLGGGGVELDGDVAALRDDEGVVAGLRDVLEDAAHFSGCLEIDLRGVAHAGFIDDHGARADADHHIVRLVVGAVEEMDVVGGDDRQREFFREGDELGDEVELGFEVVVVEFDEKVVLAVDVAEFC